MFLRHTNGWRAECDVCDRESEDISATSNGYAQCVCESFEDARLYIEAAHISIKRRHGLPARAPKNSKGFCGVVENIDGKIVKFGMSD